LIRSVLKGKGKKKGKKKKGGGGEENLVCDPPLSLFLGRDHHRFQYVDAVILRALHTRGNKGKIFASIRDFEEVKHHSHNLLLIIGANFGPGRGPKIRKGEGGAREL